MRPFPLTAVTLLDSPFRDNQRRNSAYLRFVGLDRLLHTFRTNVGLVNLYDTSNTFTVNVVGLQGSTTFQTTVQPYSMEQPALPAGVFGDLFIHVTSGASNFNWWSAYGSSVDNATGDGWV